jgi:hypothetical protein
LASSISIPLPVPIDVSMKARAGETAAKTWLGERGPGRVVLGDGSLVVEVGAVVVGGVDSAEQEASTRATIPATTRVLMSPPGL